MLSRGGYGGGGCPSSAASAPYGGRSAQTYGYRGHGPPAPQDVSWQPHKGYIIPDDRAATWRPESHRKDEVVSYVYNLLSQGPSGGRPPMSAVAPYLYLGCLQDALNVPHLQSLGVTSVLNLAPQECDQAYHASVPRNFRYSEIAAYDANYDMLHHVHEANAVIERARVSGETLLIHCRGGVNRSVFVVVSYLLMQGKALSTVLWRFKETRGHMLTNRSFVDQLIQLADRLGVLH